MKFVVIFCLCFLCTTSFGEDIAPKCKISIGAGGPNLAKFNSIFKLFESRNDFKSSGVGPFHFKFEYKIKWWLGTGLSVNYTSFRFSYSDFAIDDSSRIVINDIVIKNANTSVNLRANLYFINPENRETRSEPYFGIGLGYRFGKIKVSSQYEEYTPKITLNNLYKLGVEATVGYRFNFNEHLALYSEIGLSKSIVQLGITGSF